jgi:hypothetical protein
MDEYGELDHRDLKRIVDHFNNDIAILSESIAELSQADKGNGIFTGFVFDHVEKGSEDEKFYGFGAVKLVVPDLGAYEKNPVYARPLRMIQGRFDVPPKGAVVKVTSATFTSNMDLVYFGSDFLSRVGLYTGIVSEEHIGFRPQIAQAKGIIKAQSKYVDKVRESPEDFRILESSKDFIIFEDRDEKTLRIAVNDGWKLDLVVGDGAELNIVNKAIESDSRGSGAEFLIDSGSDGSIVIKSGSASTEKSVLGETLKSKLEELIDAVKAITVPTAMGTSGTPLNSSAFDQIKNSLDDILSEFNENN